MTADRNVISIFIDRIRKAIADYRELCLAIHNKRNQASLESLLSEQLALSVAIAWEDFVNDVLIAYISRNPKTMFDDLKNRIKKSSSDKFGVDATRTIRFRFPTKPTLTTIESFVDPRGWNVAITSAQSLSDKANQFLPAEFARKFSLDAEDTNFINLLFSLRNYLAHRSKASRVTLKSSIAAMTGDKNISLNGTLTTVSVYLKTSTKGTESRSITIADRVISIANKF
jgi:hypothetical protein